MTSMFSEDQENLERLKEVVSYGLLDTAPERDFDRLAQLLALSCGTPIALVSLIDDKKQWLKAMVGLHQQEVPLADTFCQYTLKDKQYLEIEDARKHPLLKDSRFVREDDGIRFYAGQPLFSKKGYVIGTVAVADYLPRKMLPSQRKILALVAEEAEQLMESKKKNRLLGDTLEQVLKEKIASTKAKLRQTSLDFDKLHEAINQICLLIKVSTKGNVLYFNKNFEETAGISPAILKGKPLSKVFVEFQEQDAEKLISKILDEGKYSTLLSIAGKENTKWVQATFYRIKGAHASTHTIWIIGNEITPIMEEKNKLEKANILSQSLNQYKDQFIANISHEVRTPLSAILGFSELLLLRVEDQKSKEYLQSIILAGKGLLLLINDLLDISKLESKSFQFQKSPMDVVEVVHHAIAMFIPKIENKGIKLIFDPTPNLSLGVLGDKNRLLQVLINLIGNAVKFTEKGEIQVILGMEELASDSVRVWLTVKDTGVGISHEKLPYIFDRYYQAHMGENGGYGGTGLGLNICKSIIELQGGQLQVESEVGKGSSFRFYIDYKTANAQVLVDQEGNGEELVLPNCQILLIDDSLLNQKLICAFMEGTSVKIDVAKNGKEGLEKFKSKDYDLVLTDLQMPGVNGFSFAQAIRTEIRSNVPILGISAQSMEEAKVGCLAAGMNDYLTKPITRKTLFGKINYWLDAGSKNYELTEEVNAEDESFFLERVNEMAMGNDEFRNDLLSTFVEQIEQFLIKVDHLSQQESLAQLSQEARSLQASFAVFGIACPLLNSFEQKANLENLSVVLSTKDRMRLHLLKLNDRLIQFI